MISTSFSALLLVSLINYLIYSSVAVLVVAGITCWRKSMTPRSCCLLWKWTLLVPFPLALLAVAMPGPAWVPHIELSLNANANTSQPAIEPAGEPGRATASPFALQPRLVSQPALRERADVNEMSDRRGWMSAGTVLSRLLESNQLWPILASVWLIGSGFGLMRLLLDVRGIRNLRAASQPIKSGPFFERLQTLLRQGGIRQPVELYVSADIASPLTGGITQPFILIPSRLYHGLPAAGRDAVLAHELAHVRHRDVTWNFLSLAICRLGLWQPLNWLVRRQLRVEAEYLADRWAADLLQDRLQLAQCLADLAGWLTGHTPNRRGHSLAVGMGVFRSGLGRRVAALLDGSTDRASNSRWRRQLFTALLVVGPCLLLCSVPRVSADHSSTTTTLEARNQFMKPLTSTLAVVLGLALTPAADAQTDTPTPAATAPEIAVAVKISPVPEELQRFNGMLIGKLVSRDVEKGEFTVTVDYVARVWENNKSKQPRAAVGKTLLVDGVSGKWLDSLLLMRAGDTVEFEAQHRGGDHLTFPGEWLRKVPAYDPKNYPTPPEEFRGFAGIVQGKLEAIREESGEMVIQIQKIEKTFENNKAKEASAGIGQNIVLGGFWGKMRPPLEELKAGDEVRAGVLHRVRESDHFTVAEVIGKVSDKESKPQRPKPAETDAAGFPEGMQGFRGILRGQLISRDVEKGELVFRAEKVTRVWKQNKASNVESCVERVFTTTGVSGKFLDVLLTLMPGDEIEVEAFHNRGDKLDFVGELLRKVE